MQLATVTSLDAILLILVQAEKGKRGWTVKVSLRSNLGDALLELQSNGGAATLFCLKNTIKL